MRDTKIKIRLSTSGLSLNVEVPEEKFMGAFREAADTLFAYATKPAGLPAPETADSMFEDFTTSPITKESVKVDDTPMPANGRTQRNIYAKYSKNAGPDDRRHNGSRRPAGI